jgi:hypothetical protein
MNAMSSLRCIGPVDKPGGSASGLGHDAKAFGRKEDRHVHGEARFVAVAHGLVAQAVRRCLVARVIVAMFFKSSCNCGIILTM